jgi:hypothetical protein
MLHQIKENDYKLHLEWIVNLQKHILEKLCNHEMRPPQITSEWFEEIFQNWLKLQLPGFDQVSFDELYTRYYQTRICNFCIRKDKVENCKRTLLENMQAIVGLSNDQKDNLKTAFENDQDIAATFDIPPIKRIRGILALDGFAPDILLSVRGFFESFYDPNFGRALGYDIPQADGRPARFRRDEFLKEFDYSSEKQVAVCCLCDGDRSDIEVDHFYPKSEFPFLSCHPLNLVPICSKCNGKKLEKIPLDSGAANPTANWFHPYLQPAGDNITVIFERNGKRHIPKLHSEDTQIQIRLDNLDILVEYRQGWREQLELKLRLFIRQFNPFIEEQLRNENLALPLAEEQLREVVVRFLHRQAESEKAGIGIDGYAILKYHYLKLAADQEPFLFDEIWRRILELDGILTNNPMVRIAD